MSSSAEMVGERDWRKAFRGPSSYRIINRTLLKSQTLFLLLLVGVVVVLMFLWHLYPRQGGVGGGFSVAQTGVYNKTYPLSRPIRTGSLYTFRIGKNLEIFYFSILVNMFQMSIWKNFYFLVLVNMLQTSNIT